MPSGGQALPAGRFRFRGGHASRPRDAWLCGRVCRKKPGFDVVGDGVEHSDRSVDTAASAARREPHKSPKQRTLQPPTLNPSAVVVFSRCHRDVRGDASQPVGRRITRCLLVSRRTDSFRRCAQRPSDARTSSHTPFRTTRQQGSSSFVRRDHHARLRCAAPGRKEIILNTSVVSVSRMPPMPTRLETSRGERADCAISRVSPRSRRA